MKYCDCYYSLKRNCDCYYSLKRNCDCYYSLKRKQADIFLKFQETDRIESQNNDSQKAETMVSLEAAHVRRREAAADQKRTHPSERVLHL